MDDIKSQKRVSILLGVGIFLMPYIFGWFALKSGYSRKAQIISFGWMLLFILMAVASSTKKYRPSQQRMKVESLAQAAPQNDDVATDQLKTIRTETFKANDNLLSFTADHANQTDNSECNNYLAENMIYIGQFLDAVEQLDSLAQKNPSKAYEVYKLTRGAMQTRLANSKNKC